MAKHFISDVEMVVESSESGNFYPKVLTGRPGLIPREDPQGWRFCMKESKPVHFHTFQEAEAFLLEREALTQQEIAQELKKRG